MKRIKIAGFEISLQVYATSIKVKVFKVGEAMPLVGTILYQNDKDPFKAELWAIAQINQLIENKPVVEIFAQEEKKLSFHPRHKPQKQKFNESELSKPYYVYNYDTQNVEGYFDNEIEAESYAQHLPDAGVYTSEHREVNKTHVVEIFGEKIEKQFPNGFDNWQETHFEIVSNIARIFEQNEDEWPSKLILIQEMQGIGGFYELAEELTDKFEQEHKSREWDGEFYDAIDDFLTKEFKEEQ